jgi:hypothetical protein
MGRPSKLTPKAIETAADLAADGLPVELIAQSIGCDPRTCKRWIQEGAEAPSGDLRAKFRHVIFKAEAERARKMLVALDKASIEGNVWAATWTLTHHPRFRDIFSDAAATRREADKTLGQVVKGIVESGIPKDQQRAVLLSIRANGVGVDDAAND